MDDGSKALEQIKQQLINDMGQYFDSYGANDIMGRIFALLVFAAEPLSLTEIAKALQISKAAVSINIRTLKMSGLVEKVSSPGDRSDYYRLDADYGHGMFSGIMKRVQDGLELLNRAITTMEQINPLDKTGGLEVETAWNRLTAIKDLFEFHQQMISDLQKHWSAKQQ